MAMYVGANVSNGVITSRKAIIFNKNHLVTEPILSSKAIDDGRGTLWCKKKLFFNLFMFFIILGFQLFLRIVITEQNYNIESTRKLALQNDEELRNLKLAFDYYRNPEVLKKSAQVKLAMEQAKVSKFVQLVY